jgi:hypothetical protein
MRRTGKLRYILTRGIVSGAVVAAVLVAVAWYKTGTIALTIEAMIAFVIFGLFDAARARADWNKFESIYPDIGNDR